MVQVRAVCAAGLERPRAGDCEVETLRVILGTVLTPCRVERNNLVAEDVVARGNILGDLHEPGARVSDEYVGAPVTGVGPVDVANLVDLEELERGLVDGFAIAVTVGEVVQNGSVVRIGPNDRPLDGDGVTRLDGCVAAGGCGVLVADNVACLIGVGGDEPIVCVAGLEESRIS